MKALEEKVPPCEGCGRPVDECLRDAVNGCKAREARALAAIVQPTTDEMWAYYNDPTRNRLAQIKESSRELTKEQWKQRFALIREAYQLLEPRIMKAARAGRTIDPYIIEWDWSPIEYSAWCQIRGLALPFYPQWPACGFFLDFADPFRKICIELDGKEFHDAARDAKRDEVLSREGWQVFRISGSMAHKYMENELPEHLARIDEDGAESDEEEDERRSWDDMMRRTTIDGFFKWLKAWFYDADSIAEATKPMPDEDEDE